MKRLLPFLLIIPFISKAQIEKINVPESIKISELKRLGLFVAGLQYHINDKDTIYTLGFVNEKYETIIDYQSIQFSGQETLSSLYEIMKSTFDLEEDKENAFKLGKQNVMVISRGSLKWRYITFMMIDSGASFSLKKKELNKLFDKK